VIPRLCIKSTPLSPDPAGARIRINVEQLPLKVGDGGKALKFTCQQRVQEKVLE
jgi:hypothetical protein